MKYVIQFSKYYLIIMIFLLKIELYFCQINDNFNRDILEEGNYDLLDVTDNHNLKLISTTSRNIYTGSPPALKTTTNAGLINSTSIITINENFLLAACLEDSLLSKININDGSCSSLINYDAFTPSLDIPTTTCSLSFIQNYIFIGYSKNEYIENGKVNKTNIIIRLELDDINNNDQGPYLMNLVRKFSVFSYSTYSTIISSSSRQISCEPLYIINDMEKYRLVCIYEEGLEDIYEDSMINKYGYIFVIINNAFNGFDFRGGFCKTNKTIGFRFYKINDTNGIFIMRNSIYNINLKTESSINLQIEKCLTLDSFFIEMDLFDYKSNFLFTW